MTMLRNFPLQMGLPICKIHVGGEMGWTIELTGVSQSQVPVNSIRPRLCTLLAG